MKTRIIGSSLLIAGMLLAWSEPITVSDPDTDKNFFPKLVSDGDDGAVISWLKKTDDGCYEVFTQQINTVNGEGNTVFDEPVNISTAGVGGNVAGHRLNHNAAYAFGSGSNHWTYHYWVNHFEVTTTSPDVYHKGYYFSLLRLPDGNVQSTPVCINQTVQIPTSSIEEDGEPLSVCTSEDGHSHYAAMKTRGSNYNNSWKIVVTRSVNAGSPSSTLDLYEADTEEGEFIGCPKIVRWDEDKYMVIFVSATHAATGDTSNYKLTYLHFYEVEVDEVGGVLSTGTHHTVRFPSSGDIPSKLWYYWIPYFDVTANEDNTELYVAYQLRMKKMFPRFDFCVSHYFIDSLFVLKYDGTTPDQGTGIDGWKASPYSDPDQDCIRDEEDDCEPGTVYNNRPSIDDLPLRAPSIAYLNSTDGVVVVYPRAYYPTDWPTQNDWNQWESYPYRVFGLFAYQVEPDGDKNHLWTLQSGTGSSYHTPHVISDGGGGYLVTYSKHHFRDYSGGNSPNGRASVVLGQGLTGYLDNLNTTELEASGSNCSPQVLLIEDGGNKYALVTWGHADHGSYSWSIKADRKSLPLPTEK
ncbi:hypothetical protein JXM67_15270 [candidate division WOR-3 bacterium]|nr:hypothetical protein [candidate division WOR-3 bacterium]